MGIRKSAKANGLQVWTVAELGAFYTEHRAELHAHAARLLKNNAKAEEVLQDALIKVMLAAPELESNNVKGFPTFILSTVDGKNLEYQGVRSIPAIGQFINQNAA